MSSATMFFLTVPVVVVLPLIRIELLQVQLPGIQCALRIHVFVTKDRPLMHLPKLPPSVP